MATKKKKKIDVSKSTITITIDGKSFELTNDEAGDLYRQLKHSLNIIELPSFPSEPYTPIDKYPDWTNPPWTNPSTPTWPNPIANPTVIYGNGFDTKPDPLTYTK